MSKTTMTKTTMDSDSDLELEEVIENASGWHFNDINEQFCLGCETGTDCSSAHCTACNDIKNKHNIN